ncbi:MAG: response regulator [Arthrospira sp. PLM2.Bin9]|nr:response regulator [Arthrospira sp. PLM2.Bin9]TVU52087.1 MAG: response regulator [Arthrospira sp. PLM2.Bin9]
MSSELSAASLSHILVVDAIPDNIGIFSQILASPAYKVQVLNSGSLAREWLRFPANFPDLILLNGDIPDVDGYQLCEQLKADDATCNIPVIFILDDLANRVQVFTAGGADYITYPLESVEIIAKIQHQLEWRSLQIQLDQVTDNHPQTTWGKYQVAADLSDFSAIIQELIGVKPEEIMANPKMLMDIIDMKQVEQRLALRETQLRAIFEQAAVGINQADIKSGLFIRANQCFCELLGYSEHELYQKTFEQVTHPEDLIRCRPLMQELHRGEIESVSLEKRYLHKNGMAIWTKGSFSLIYNSQGEAISHLAIVVDISDRRRAEEALKFSQARLESIATNIPGAIYSYVVSSDNLFGFEYISEGCRELFELEAEQVLADSKILLQQIHPDDVPTYYQKIMDSQADLSSFSHEWRHILPSGKTRWILGNCRPEKRPNGDILWQGVVLDIGDRKQAEEELVRAKEVAEAANQAKTTFLTNMSHELRTPLNAILGFTQLLNYGDNLTEHQHNNLNIIQRSGEHLLSLINDILDLSKIEAGRVTVSDDDFDLWRMLDEIKDLFSLKASQKNIYLDCVYSPDLPRYIRGDRLKLRQIMINLIGNAIKFTEQGRVVITADHKFISSSPSICCLQIAVTDSGVGMTPEEIAQLYEPFFQAQAGIDSQEGTGLGLTICQKYLQLMGAEIEVISEVGHGTNFKFKLKVVVSEYNPRAKNLKPSPKPQQLDYNHSENNREGEQRILIVEDNSDNQQLLYQILSPLGFQIQQATDGEEAIAIWQNFRPHLIWMDLRIPLIDGYEVTREIRRQEKSLGISPNSQDKTIIIALTASAFVEERSEAIEAGCDEFVHKPIEVPKIMTYIAKFFGNDYQSTETMEVIDSIYPNVDKNVDKIANQLAQMPLEWRTALADAVMTLNEPEINSLIEEISPQASELAIALSQFAINFDYESIWEMLEVQND